MKCCCVKCEHKSCGDGVDGGFDDDDADDAELLMQVHFSNGEYIIRQDARGDTFYIIASGRVSLSSWFQFERYHLPISLGRLIVDKKINDQKLS